MSTVAERALARTPSRRLTVLFFSIAAIGIVVAFVLGMHEVNNTPALSVSDARVRQNGLVAVVQVTVHNGGNKSVCPVIQIAACNRDGLDIAKQQGAPVDGVGRIDPGSTVGFRTEFDQLTAKNYEGLDKFVGFVDAERRC